MTERIFYVLICRECDPDGEFPMPFESAEARGRWAGEHTRGTGHDSWYVVDQRLTPTPEAVRDAN